MYGCRARLSLWLPDLRSRRIVNSIPTLSIVLPAYREAEHLGSTLRAVHDQADSLGVPFEIVVVDDGSDDDTWSVLEQAAGEMPALRCLSFSRNFGKESAILAGLATARGDAVILLDADLQHPPALIAEMFRLWQSGHYKIVNAIKEHRGSESISASLAAKTFYNLFHRLSKIRLEGSSDFKLLDREVVDLYCRLPERNTFFRGIVPWLGFEQVDLPFRVAERAGGWSKWSLIKRGVLAINAIVSFSALPLHIVTLAGLVFLTFALLLGTQTVYLKLTGGAVEGFTTVILLIIIIGSILMLSLGIIGQYLAKIYEETKGRPRYLIRRQIRAQQPPFDPSLG
jgi:polyisoprenyl-phosphate glycosyltransferase